MKANDAITIGGVRVLPGERRNLALPIADLYTTTSLQMPLHAICGRQAGPTAFVSAAVHGDEINGVEIVRRLLKLKSLDRIKGNLLLVPVVNVHGFVDRSRYLPDRRDLNRSFPGTSTGSIAARLANVFTREVAFRADFGIDLHTGAIDHFNLPQLRVTRGDREARRLARAFGAPVIVEADACEGSLRTATSAQQIPVLVYEAGEALRFDELSIKTGVRGVQRVLRACGMLSRRPESDSTGTVIATHTRWVRAPASGVVTQREALGARVGKGDTLALMTDPLGTTNQAVRSPSAGIIIGRSNLPLAHEGDALFNIARFQSVERAEGVVEDFATTGAFPPEP